MIKTHKISVSPNYNFIEAIGDRLLLRDWYNSGLPADDTSSENAIMISRGINWPMLIDPQLQANKWIKNMYSSKETVVVKEKRNEEDDDYDSQYDPEEEENNKLNAPGLKVIKFDTEKKDKLKILKAAVINGFPLLIEDVGETIDSIVDPLLAIRMALGDNMKAPSVKIDGEDVEIHSSFMLFMTTKLSNPHFLPNIFIKTTVINFTVTPKGLEEQLLCDVVLLENPSLEKDRIANLENMTKFKKILQQQEKDILASLNKSIESLVETPEMIEQLKESKTTSEHIRKQETESEISSKVINETREKYRSVAVRGSILYFVIDEISKIDPMYQYSLQYIKKLFCGAIEGASREADEAPEVRNLRLLEITTKAIYTNISRGLFEEHKFIFSQMICIRIMLKSEALDPRLWEIFIRGPPPYDSGNKPTRPTNMPTLTEFNWDVAYYLDITFPQFQDICRDIATNLPIYQIFANSNNPFDTPIPEKCRLSKSNLSDFEKILLIKILRQEKVLYSLESFVEKNLGSYFVGSLEVKMEDVFSDSDCRTPIIFVLSQGADPRSAIEKLANEKGVLIGVNREYLNKEEGEEQPVQILMPISLGQGQGPLARTIILQCIQTGDWALLENCHLAKSWMPELEKEIEALQKNDKINPKFRIFLTSMPTPYFPVSILQNGIKLTTEPPRGIKANMIRSLNFLTNDFLDANPNMRDATHKLTMGLCFFHAIVQERRKFGPLGWNKRYEFNDSDLETSKTVLQNLLSPLTDENYIPWDTLVFLTGTINYGGRVTDDQDKRLIMTIIDQFYRPEILDARFTFCDNEDYYIPKVENLEAYKEYANSLDLNDDPAVFGMHKNANMSYQAQETEKLIRTIQKINPSRNSGGGGGSDEIVMQHCEKLLNPEEGVPSQINIELIHPHLMELDERGLKPPLTTVLLQEVERFNKLIGIIVDSLEKLVSAIKGTIIMSAVLDNVYFCLLNNQVPDLWSSNAYPSLKPLFSWVKDLAARITFMREWLEKCNPGNYALPYFIFPQGFLTGVLQTFARKNKVAIDKLKFDFRVADPDKDKTNEPPVEGGVYISGMYLEGARWDLRRRSLQDQIEGVMYDEIPPIAFIPVEIKEMNPKDMRKSSRQVPTYSCPVYKTTVRAGELSTTGQSTNYVLSVNLPTLDHKSDVWILRGAALICQLND